MSEMASKSSTGAAARWEVLPPQGDSQSGRVSALAFRRTRATSRDGKPLFVGLAGARLAPNKRSKRK
jgi:hypothetical protein